MEVKNKSPPNTSVMKNHFVIFYSWLSDLPDKDNRKLIRKAIEKETKTIGKSLNVKIDIDSDSRGEDGKENIDDTILRKISNADLFVADITPIKKTFGLFGKKKHLPNPNVLYELGYAVSTLGWNRCILIWNLKYGDVKYAPFDIRNHTVLTYRSPNSPNLRDVLKKKIEKYEDLVKEWRTTKERSFDIERYKAITDICSERNLIDSIDSFFTNRVYNKLEFDWWNDTCYYYKHYPDNRFLDEELHSLYLAFIDNLNKMVLIAVKYNIQAAYSKRPDNEVGTIEYKKECVYRIQDPYNFASPAQAEKLEREIEDAFNNLLEPLMNSYTAFRDCLRAKLLI